MYEVEMITIASKPSDYKVCKKCHRANWYENEECTHADCDGKDFDESEEAVNKWIDEEYQFWEDDGYTEEQADHILVEV